MIMDYKLEQVSRGLRLVRQMRQAAERRGRGTKEDWVKLEKILTLIQEAGAKASDITLSPNIPF